MKKKSSNGTYRTRKLDSGNWQCEVSLGNHPLTGKRIRKSFTARTEKESRLLAAEYERMYRRGIDIDSRDTLVSIYLDKWFETYQSKRELAASSVRRYGELLAHVNKTLGDVPIGMVTPTHLDEFCRVNRQHDWLFKAYGLAGSAFADAVKYDLLERSPFWKHDGPKKPKAKEVEPFTEKELGLLMPRLEGEWIGPLIKFALSSGCRIGEMIGLTWSDIEFDADDSRPGFVQISRSVRTNDVNGIVVSPPKTARGRRKIELSSITMKLLAEKAVVNNSRGLVTDEWTENELVFPSRAGTYSYQSNVLKEFKRICKAAGIDRTVNLHMCRHSHATIAIKSGVDLHTLSRRMGHSSISITADLYGHLIEGMQSVAAQAFDEIIR